MALCRAVETSQARGFRGTPLAGQSRSATANDSWSASSAMSKSPRRRIRVASARGRSSRYSASRSIRPESSRAAEALALVGSVLDGKNVSGRVLEPRHVHPATAVDVPFALHPGHVVVLELDALGLQVLDRPVHVLDFPERRGSLVGARELGLVDAQVRAAAPVDDRLALHFADFLEPERLLVELPRWTEVLHGEHGLDIRFFEHFGSLLSGSTGFLCITGAARPESAKRLFRGRARLFDLWSRHYGAYLDLAGARRGNPARELDRFVEILRLHQVEAAEELFRLRERPVRRERLPVSAPDRLRRRGVLEPFAGDVVPAPVDPARVRHVLVEQAGVVFGGSLLVDPLVGVEQQQVLH